MKYKWNEDKYLQEALDYINATYSGHYVNNSDEDTIQFTEYFASRHSLEETVAAFKFNIQKYVDRLGRKEGYNKKDAMKAIHYTVMMLSIIDKQQKFPK